MQLTQQTDFALRMLVQLAGQPGDRWTPVREIAEAQGLSAHHLLKIAHALAQHGWIEAQRGAGGGVRLAVQPASLRVGEVVRRIEPHMGLVGCLRDPPGACALLPGCRLKTKLCEALGAFLAVLDATTLADCLPPVPTPAPQPASKE